MKRIIGLGAIALLGACGGQAENKAKAAAASLEPGQYEVVASVTQFRQADEGAPKINTPVGTRTTRSVCVADGAALPPDLFADEGLTCQNAGEPYNRNGRINLNVRCTRPDLKGEIAYAVSGTYEAQAFRADRQLTTSFTTDGDVVASSTAEGRRTGACTAAPAGGNAAGAAKAK